MTTAPEFLQRLGLGASATARDIRRAYAQRLRRVDPEVDAQGFQALREAYEAALRWAEGRGADNPEPASPSATKVYGGGAGSSEAAPPVSSTGVPRPMAPACSQQRPPPAAAVPHAADRMMLPDPVEQAQAMLGELRSKLAEITTEPNAWKAIEACLADPRLQGLEARFHFEKGIVEMLASGWAPGHEHLFAGATDLFRWSKDHGRLSQFGRAGVALDAALQQSIALDQLDGSSRVEAGNAAALLRARERPPRQELLRLAQAVQQLSVRAPELLRVVVPAGSVEQWRSWYEEIPPKRRVYRPPRPRTPMSTQAKQTLGMALIFGTVLIVGALAAVSSHGPPRSSAPLADPRVPKDPAALVRECDAGNARACSDVADQLLERSARVRLGRSAALDVLRKACGTGNLRACQAHDLLENVGDDDGGGATSASAPDTSP